MIPFSRVFIGKFDHFQFELFLLITLADNLHVGLDGQLDIGVITKNRHLLLSLSLRLVFPILFVFFLFLSFFSRTHSETDYLASAPSSAHSLSEKKEKWCSGE